MINTLNAQIWKGRNMLQQIGNFDKEMVNLRNRQWKCQKQKNTEMNNVLKKLISSFHTAETRISKFEEITQTECKRKNCK